MLLKERRHKKRAVMNNCGAAVICDLVLVAVTVRIPVIKTHYAT